METARSPSVPGAVTTYVSKAALFTVGTSDRGKYFDNAGSYTISLTAAATMGNGFSFWVRNTSGTQTIDPNGAELINGAATLSVANASDVWLITCTGTAWVASREYAQAITCTSLTDSGLTATRLTFAGTGGLLSDDANLTYSGGALSNAGGDIACSGYFRPNNSISAFLNGSQSAFYSSNSGGGSFPFTQLGNAVIEARGNGNNRAVVLAASGGAFTAYLDSTGVWNIPLTTDLSSLNAGGAFSCLGGGYFAKAFGSKGFLQAVNTTAKTAAYTCTLNDFKVRFNATTSAIVASLPAAPISGHILCISKTDATANAVTISGTIDGAADPTLTVQYQKKLIMYSGAWESIA